MKTLTKSLTLALLVAFAFTSCAKQPTQEMTRRRPPSRPWSPPRATSTPRTS